MEAEVGAEVAWLALEDLKAGPSPREGPLNSAHVAALAEVDGRWPPIVVCRRDGRVIDGHHRVEAARLVGRQRVPAVLFDGPAEDAFVEAVRRNVEHGLPLTIDERKTAARRLLSDHVDWSDRRIAEVCALSPRTVARLRAAGPDRTRAADCRIGRDGRGRPVRSEATRIRIMAAVRANPDASLRAIARATGTSPETVRRIRQKVHPHDQTNGVPRSAAILPFIGASPSVDARHPSATDDPAMTSTPDGKEFAAWFDRTDVGRDWRMHVAAMPLSRVYEVADEARRRARAWSEFAELVELRARAHQAV